VNLRASVCAAILGVAALAASPAWADFVIYGGSSYSSVSELDDICAGSTCNGQTNWGGTVNGFSANMFITGVDLVGPNELMDLENFEIDNKSGANSLTLEVTETNLTSLNSVEEMLSTFSGNIKNTLDVTTTFYVNLDNAGYDTHGTSIDIGSITCDSGKCSVWGTNTEANVSGFTGKFSLTEEIDITNAGKNAQLSSDDNVSIPEPASLGLLGMGLLAFGAMRWRSKSSKARLA